VPLCAASQTPDGFVTRPWLADSHRLRHFLFTWLKTQGIDDALIQPYSSHASRTSLEIYSRLALPGAQASYDGVIGQFPV
jgi:integrase/recombinase XerD